MEDTLLDELIGRGTAREIIAQAILHTSVSPTSNVGVVGGESGCGSAPEVYALAQQGRPGKRDIVVEWRRVMCGEARPRFTRQPEGICLFAS